MSLIQTENIMLFNSMLNKRVVAEAIAMARDDLISPAILSW